MNDFWLDRPELDKMDSLVSGEEGESPSALFFKVLMDGQIINKTG